MTTTTLPQARTSRPAPTSPIAGGNIVVPIGPYEVDASAEITTASDKLRLGVLPAGHVITDIVFACDELDAGTAVVLDIGIEDTTQDPSDTTDVDALIDGSTVAQAGGVVRMSAIAGLEIAAVNYDRYITATVITPPTTDQDGGIAGWFSYRPEMRGA